MYYRIEIYNNGKLILISSDTYKNYNEVDYICKKSSEAFANCKGIEFKVKEFYD